MLKIKSKENASIILFILCWVVYSIISMTKTAFSSSISSIVADGILTNSDAGIISAAYYIFYGGAQLLLVKLVDKVSPFKFISISLLGSVISMTGFALTDSFSSPIVPYSTEVLVAKSEMASFVDSLVAPMSIINAIIAYIGKKKHSEVTETLQRLENVWHTYHVYTSSAEK